jgi:hypothetical protein
MTLLLGLMVTSVTSGGGTQKLTPTNYLHIPTADINAKWQISCHLAIESGNGGNQALVEWQDLSVTEVNGLLPSIKSHLQKVDQMIIELHNSVRVYPLTCLNCGVFVAFKIMKIKRSPQFHGLQCPILVVVYSIL